jgi:hypothetical protein
MTTATTTRARLLEYAPWIMRDYLLQPGLGTVVVLLLVGVATVAPLLATAGDSYVMGRAPNTVAGPLLAIMTDRLSFLAAFFATNGIVANDRKLSYYRFLFAKPVRPWAYYAATFGLYGLGVLLVTIPLALLWGYVVAPALSLELLLVVALIYLAYGGLGFLLSAAWRFDWLSLISVIVVANLGWWAWGNATGPRHWVLYLLPPVHRDEQVFAMLASADAAVPWVSVAWLGGYGLICFLLGLVVIHKRPLGTS